MDKPFNGDLQAAINAVRGIVEKITLGMTTAPEILIPDNTILSTASTITTYPGVRIKGMGPGSKIRAAAGFSGTHMIELNSLGVTTAGNRIELIDVELDTTLAPAVWALGQGLGIGGDMRAGLARLKLYLNSQYGLDLKYLQTSDIWLYSYGAANRIAIIRGNDNDIWIDKEGASTGTSTEPYVEIADHGLGGNSVGNRVNKILIEGTCDAGKTPLRISGCRKTEVGDFYYETGASNQYAPNWCEVADCPGMTHFVGKIHHNGQKLAVTNSRPVIVDVLTGNPSVDAGSALFSVDASSFLYIDVLEDFYGRSVIPQSGQVVVRHSVSKNLGNGIVSNGVVGHSPISNGRHRGGNLFVNPSFEAGTYGWTATGGASTSLTTAASRFGIGQMAVFTCSVDGTYFFSQNITISADHVGKPITVAALAEVVGGTTAYARPRVSGCGISTTAVEHSFASHDTGAQLICWTVIPQSAGTLSVGFFGVNMTAGVTTVYLDDAYVGFGVEGQPDPGRFGTIQLGTVPVLSGSGTPEAAVTAPVGSLYLRTNGGASTTLYIKESGTGNTGWVGK